jgi:hypothetical protein
MSIGVVLAQTNGSFAGGLDVFILWGALRLAGVGSYLAKSPLVRPFPLEAWCWSTAFIAMILEFVSH